MENIAATLLAHFPAAVLVGTNAARPIQAAGELDPAIEENGFFHYLVSADQLLGRPAANPA